MGSKHLPNYLNAVTERGQLAVKFIGHPKQLRISMRPIAHHPSPPNSLPSNLFFRFQCLLHRIHLPSTKPQSVAPAVLYNFHLLPPSILVSVLPERQPPFPAFVRSAGECNTLSVQVAFDELRRGGREDNRVDPGAVVAEIEVCVRGVRFVWKRGRSKKELLRHYEGA